MLKNMSMNNTHKILFALAVIASMGLGIVFGAQQFSSPPSVNVAQLLPSTKTMPKFSFEKHDGEKVSETIFHGHWNLVFFGFTSCPDYCPMELQKLGKLLSLMGAGDDLQVVFVSVDPERDHQEKLANYASFFHPQIIGLRATNVELASFAQFFGAAYDRSVIVDGKLLSIPAGVDMPSTAGEHYQVNHSTRVFIVNPTGEYIGSFSSPYNLDDILFDMKALMDW